MVAGIVGKHEVIALNRRGDLNALRAVDVVDDVIDRLGRGEVDHGALAAAVGDADFAGGQRLGRL